MGRTYPVELGHNHKLFHSDIPRRNYAYKYKVMSDYGTANKKDTRKFSNFKGNRIDPIWSVDPSRRKTSAREWFIAQTVVFDAYPVAYPPLLSQNHSISMFHKEGFGEIGAYYVDSVTLPEFAEYDTRPFHKSSYITPRLVWSVVMNAIYKYGDRFHHYDKYAEMLRRYRFAKRR